MRSLPFSTRIRIGNERTVKEWVKLSIDRMVHEAVTHGSFMNIARLRIGNLEGLVWAMPVRLCFQVPMKCENVAHERMLELLHVTFASLAPHELFPSREQILHGDDIVVTMSEQNPLRANPPLRVLPVVEHTKALYRTWLPVRRNMGRDERFGIGSKIDALFLDLLETLRVATYAGGREKLPLLTRAVGITDSLRFFVQIAWEAKLIPNKQFEEIGVRIEEMGRMIGGWRKGLIAKTPPAQE